MILPPRISSFLGRHIPALLTVWPFECFIVFLQTVIAVPSILDDFAPDIMFTMLPFPLATLLMLTLLLSAATVATGMRIRSATLLSSGLWLGGFASVAVVAVLITAYPATSWILAASGAAVTSFIFLRAIYWGALARGLQP